MVCSLQLLSLFAVTLSAYGDKESLDVTQFIVNSDRPMIRVYRYDNGTVASCQIFSNREIIDKELYVVKVEAMPIDKQEFNRLRKECLSAPPLPVEPIPGQGIGNLELGLEMLSGIYPGTLWCGAGNIADTVDTEDGLGEKKKLDACCRTHDNCPINIGGWSKKFGLRNLSPITCSDCGCDKTFRSCLRDVADPEADALGKIFFNTVSIDCIRLNFPRTCVESFFGVCIKYETQTNAPKVYEFYDGLQY